MAVIKFGVTALGFPAHYLDRIAIIEGRLDGGCLNHLGPPTGMETENKRVLHDTINSDVPGGHESEHVAALTGLIIPLVTVGNCSSTNGFLEFRAALISSGLDPPLGISKTPAGPLSDAVILRVAVLIVDALPGPRAGNFLVVNDPSLGRGLGPDRITGHTLVHVRAKR